ncbi:MAG TPA: RDD family protein [Vicinamibacterales bacterium]|jgi:uncharacterized RDD family membrane protein YckC
MKCPKCGYLGFDDMERCRNCGYDFSFSQDTRVPDLTIRTDNQKLGPLDDLTLVDAATVPHLPTGATPDLDRGFVPPRSQSPAGSEELPLFGGRPDDDRSTVSKIAASRGPVAVRRAGPEVARIRSAQPRAQALDWDFEEDDVHAEEGQPITPAARATAAAAWPSARPEPAEPAAVVSRLIAVLIDLIILAVVDFVVVYFTLRICGVTTGDISLLPAGPLVAFLVVQNGGYLAAFTAGGQTIGKMIAGIRVVATESAGGSLDFGRAVTRTIVWIMLAVPAGLGFLTVLSRDHRGLHDRFAGTRVVRASA